MWHQSIDLIFKITPKFSGNIVTKVITKIWVCCLSLAYPSFGFMCFVSIRNDKSSTRPLFRTSWLLPLNYIELDQVEN